MDETDVQIVYEFSENNEIVKLDEAWHQTWASMATIDENEVDSPIKVDSSQQEPALRQTNIQSRYQNTSQSIDMANDNEVDAPGYSLGYSPIKVDSSQEPVLRQTNIRSRYHNTSRSKDMAENNQVNSLNNVSSTQTGQEAALRQTPENFKSMTMINWKIPKICKAKKPLVQNETNSTSSSMKNQIPFG